MVCPKCNATITDGSNFCPKCGQKIESEPTPIVSSSSEKKQSESKQTAPEIRFSASFNRGGNMSEKESKKESVKTVSNDQMRTDDFAKYPSSVKAKKNKVTNEDDSIRHSTESHVHSKNSNRTNDIKKTKVSLILTILALLIMFVGIIVALFAKLDTTLHEGSSVPASITVHVVVIMLFVVVSDILLLISNKMKTSEGKLLMPHWLFHSTYAITGLFFSIASAYQARAIFLFEFYSSIKAPGVPPVYAEVFTSQSWFEKLPGAASSFSTLSTVFDVLTVIGVIAMVAVLVHMRSDKRKSNSQDDHSNKSN